MSDSDGVSNGGSGAPGAKSAWVPGRAVGWWALGLSALGVAAWIVLPMITGLFADKYPITNTGVMPAIGTVLIGVAAVFNVLCIWPWRERSALNIIAAAITIPMALFLTFMVVGGALGGDATGDIPESQPDMTYVNVEGSSREGQALVLSLRTESERAAKMGRPLEGVKYSVASVRVDQSTAIYRQAFGGLKPGTTDDVLAAGHMDVWFKGPVEESNPVQATAGTILIIAE